MNWKLIWEAVKEPLREIVLAIIPIILVQLQTLTVPWAGALYLFLRWLDSYLHEFGKATKSETLITGIVRF